MKYKVTLNGRTYEVEVEAGKAMCVAEYEAYAPASAPIVAVAAPAAAPVAAPAPAAPAAGVTVSGGESVNAPMPGNILKVNVSVGQSVKEGDLLCVLEAMKMENEIYAPCAGTVSAVPVSKGSTVNTCSYCGCRTWSCRRRYRWRCIWSDELSAVHRRRRHKCNGCHPV